MYSHFLFLVEKSSNFSLQRENLKKKWNAFDLFRKSVCYVKMVPYEQSPSSWSGVTQTPHEQEISYESSTNTLGGSSYPWVRSKCMLGADKSLVVAPTLWKRTPSTSLSVAGCGSRIYALGVLSDGTVKSPLWLLWPTIFPGAHCSSHEMSALIREQRKPECELEGN